MHQRCRLQSVTRLFAGHLRTGELAQLGIDLREQRFRSIRLAALDSTEEEREVGHGAESVCRMRTDASKRSQP